MSPKGGEGNRIQDRMCKRVLSRIRNGVVTADSKSR